MIKHQILKRDKFLVNCGTFFLVSFSANKQSNFLAFKEFLYLNNFKVKFLKSKSIKKCLENYIKPDFLVSLTTTSCCPLFMIKPRIEANFLNSFFNFNQKFFVDNKIFLISCFYRGKTYFPRNLFLLEKKAHLNFIRTIYNFYINFFAFFNLCDIFLLKLLVLLQRD